MRKTLLLTVTLLAATWLAATSMPGPDSNKPSKAGEKTITGCLSLQSGAFTLTGPDGTQYVLTGSGDMANHVGREVRVHGMQDAPAVTSAVTGNKATTADSGTLPTFSVESISDVSASCPNGERK